MPLPAADPREHRENRSYHVTITGIAPGHNAGDPLLDKGGTNYINIIDLGGLRIAHFGDIGQVALTASQLKKIEWYDDAYLMPTDPALKARKAWLIEQLKLSHKFRNNSFDLNQGIHGAGLIKIVLETASKTSEFLENLEVPTKPISPGGYQAPCCFGLSAR